MKVEILGLLAGILLIGCEKKCDDMEATLTAQYLTALNNCGTSQSAIKEVTRQYNEKLSKIQKDCR